MSNETARLANYLHEIKFQKLDSHTIDAAKMAIADFIGVAIAGTEKAPFKIWTEYLKNRPDAPEANVFAAGFSKTSVEHAAALNAVSGHVMDLDDVHNASIAHLGVVTIPAAFALAQKFRKAGADVIEAVTAGFEAGARIGECINPSSYKYWHTTGIVGPFASGTAASHLLALDEKQTLNMLGSAGTESAGLWEFLKNSGQGEAAMSKTLHTANANLCGIRAAWLAKYGFTGSTTIIEGERGLARAVAPVFNLGAITKGYGEGYKITQNSLKPYACCRHIHSANYAMQQLIKKYSLRPQNITSIEDRTYSTAAETANNPYPEDAYAAKFSIQFCLAALLVLGNLSDKVFTKENLSNVDILRLMSKIHVILDKEIDNEYKKDPDKWTHKLIIQMTDGKKIVEQIDYPIGDANNPFSWNIEKQKFDSLTIPIIGKEISEILFSKIFTFENVSDVSTFFDQLHSQNG